MGHNRKGEFYKYYFICPKCRAYNEIYRYADSSGKLTWRLCRNCRKYVRVLAGENNKNK